MYKKILVPIDGSSPSKEGLSEAIKLAKNQGAQLRLFHMVNERILDYTCAEGIYGGQMIATARETGQNVMSEAQAMARREGVEPESVLVDSIDDSAAAWILRQAKEWPADLIVMGTHGRRGLARLAIGSNAESVVRQAPVPVLLVHHEPTEASVVVHKEGTPAADTQVTYA